jgi:phage shock protein C
MEKTLRKSREDSMVFGVCGGLAEYLNLDATIVRIALVAFTFFGGSGLLLYIILAIIMK